MAEMLELIDLHVSIDGKKILNGINLRMKKGEKHVLMGPNGSGKSTLAMIVMGNPKYKVEKGDILLDRKSILSMKADERSRQGIFLSFQYPAEVEGVSLSNFLRNIYNNSSQKKLSLLEFGKLLDDKMKILEMDKKFSERSLNEGFSGGEKKRNEILQMNMLAPSFAILDEIDSGLDIDSIRLVSDAVNKMQDTGFLLITHYNRILNFIRPDFVHVLIDGKIAESGDWKIADQLEKKGYAWLKPSGGNRG